MLQNIIPALIGGIFTLLAAFISIYHQDLFSIFRFRKRNIKGVWTGYATEKLLGNDSEELKYDVSIEFKQFGSRITAKASVSISIGEHFQATCKGRMEDEYFITLRSYSTSIQESNFGVAVFELDSTGKKLHGYSLANSLTKHGIALAEVFFTKQPS
jgi:hypothetical protein